ncbi:MAG: crossover junction endodeoxyribonuclease RuvC [Candidatus Sumerlaeaceae bacterium]|nr:crossover junction endodeoxyribonuclease RuvC [Candidatus Sumerlaeaceae bacterium]
MRIIGIDPGLASTGYGVIDHDGQRSRLVTAGCIETIPTAPLAGRLRTIHDDLVAVIRETAPDCAAMEQLFFCTNVRTAISVAQGRGVAILATAASEIPLHEYTPLQIKQAVAGFGRATKQQVELMVRAMLRLGTKLDTTHAADALAVALCHAHASKFAEAVARATRTAPPARRRPIKRQTG